jgi:hypothetical protein
MHRNRGAFALNAETKSPSFFITDFFGIDDLDGNRRFPTAFYEPVVASIGRATLGRDQPVVQSVRVSHGRIAAYGAGTTSRAGQAISR